MIKTANTSININNENIKNFGFHTIPANIPPQARIRKFVLSPVNIETPIEIKPTIPEKKTSFTLFTDCYCNKRTKNW